MRHIVLFLVSALLYCVDMDVLRLDLPEKVVAERIKTKESDTIKITGPHNIEFSIELNLKNNSYLSCFCAPINKYETIKINGQDALRLVMETGSNRAYTLKIRGQSSSVSIHYSAESLDNYETVKKIAESIVLKNDDKPMKMGLR